METPLAMIWTTKRLYPDRFKDSVIEDEARAFYDNFYNQTVTDELIYSDCLKLHLV